MSRNDTSSVATIPPASAGGQIETLFDASVSAGRSSDRTDQSNEIRHEVRAHTEASIAIMLYEELQRANYLTRLDVLESVHDVGPGTLVEIAGTVEKNPVDSLIDFCDALTILATLAPESERTSAPAQSTKKPPKNQATKPHSAGPLARIRDTLDEDRMRTPISNVLLHCSSPKDLRGVVTLRRENLRDLTLSELHKNSVRIVGKVTRTIGAGKTMSTFENYGLAMLPKDKLAEIFSAMMKQRQIVVPFGVDHLEVEGPAVQLLPLMIYV